MTIHRRKTDVCGHYFSRQRKICFCRHKDIQICEIPGGHREDGENIIDTAGRELYEETGALEFDINPVCAYSVSVLDSAGLRETFGMLFHADIHTFESELHSEIEKIMLTDVFPKKWTYPVIQPKLLEEAKTEVKFSDQSKDFFSRKNKNCFRENFGKAVDTPHKM